ncbi:uncharacterized protein EV154DRAFT_442464 [Mucor mucedo]|uniref:uncharacterized protein n=1 Tax=Mucor mucedo TaxID=29922 RepID=UPI002220A4B2|nr:uncharacterized protein EV154DRAFT_442464 [Mucor mucedo]KAI7891912.1 hypothetical protein EV154DRAFT_442464 [Mucor mucedo]
MKQTNAGASASKKIRMTMACERCRSKKVKCDFSHPHCERCQQAKAQCSYDGSATQVDLFNLVKLNNTVDILQKRVQSIETDIKEVCSNTEYVANEVRMNSSTIKNDDNKKQEDTRSIIRTSPPPTNIMNDLMNTSNAQWQLSLTPKGLRIDTNIVSLHALYDILLSGVSRFDLSGNHCMHDHNIENSSQSSSSTTTDNSRPDTATILKKKPLWKSRLKTFPLYSSWESENKHPQAESKADIIYNEETMRQLVEIFCECFLCLPCPDPNYSIYSRYKSGTLDPLLANAVFAWTARHAAIYHDLFPGKDPNQVGKPFFSKAKDLMKERFMQTSIDTMHSLIIMYIYAIGIPSEHKAEVESEAYIYLGLAIRMCLDLKMHQESKSDNPYEQEQHRRYFWVVYFLETLGSIHSDKPFSLPPKNMVTVGFPTILEHESSGETKYRVEFMIQRFKITRIYRNIIYKTAEEKPLLSQISAIDKELDNWYTALPSYLKYEAGDLHKREWNSTSFKEQSCIKLNFEYNFQLCQLYGLFFSKASTDQPSTIDVLSRDVCLKAARNTVELLECWVQLKQRWCHFSLENLMITTIVYGSILSQPNDPEHKIAKRNLEKMAKILLSAPVRHHKYVLTLVNRIKAIFLETLQTKLVIEQEEQEPVFPVGMSSGTIDNTVQPIISTNQFVQRNTIYNVLDVPSASSAYDIHKTDSFSDEMHFSDFVYTPTLLDYETANMLSASSYGKKPDYAASSPYRYSSPQYYSYDTPNTNNSLTPPFHSPWIPTVPPVMLNHPVEDRPPPFSRLPFDKSAPPPKELQYENDGTFSSTEPPYYSNLNLNSEK